MRPGRRVNIKVAHPQAPLPIDREIVYAIPLLANVKFLLKPSLSQQCITIAMCMIRHAVEVAIFACGGREMTNLPTYEVTKAETSQ